MGNDLFIDVLKGFSNRWVVLQKALTIKGATSAKSRAKLERYYTVEAPRLFVKNSVPFEELNGIFEEDKKWVSKYFVSRGATLDDIRNAMQEEFGIKGPASGEVSISNPDIKQCLESVHHRLWK